MEQNLLQKAVEKPLFDPTFVNIDYYFNKVYLFLQWLGLFRNDSYHTSGALSGASTSAGTAAGTTVSSVSNGLHLGSTIYLISYVLSLFGITIIIYALVRMFEIQKDENGHLKHEIAEAMERRAHEENGRDPRWVRIERLMSSGSEADWRLAIIEADNLLEDLLDEKGVVGDTIGEKLKSLGAGGLSSLQAAWDAHSVRNQIAHEGLEYELSEREARRTIGLFEIVFRELGLAL
jgi:hypothetical protein